MRPILPGAPNFQHFLEEKGNLEAVLVARPDTWEPEFSKAVFQVILNGDTIGEYSICGRGDLLNAATYIGVVPDHGRDKLILHASCFGDDAYRQVFIRRDTHENIPFL